MTHLTRRTSLLGLGLILLLVVGCFDSGVENRDAGEANNDAPNNDENNDPNSDPNNDLNNDAPNNDGPCGQDLNACGGCAVLEGELGQACGVCGSGELACDGVDALRCDGDAGDAALNACGGCGELDGDLGEDCGTCDSGMLACDGAEALSCQGDLGEAAYNACGGCTPLEPPPGSACGPCLLDRLECSGMEATACDGATACPIGVVLVREGAFDMGSPASELGHNPTEAPVHRVRLTRSFLIQQTEVTQAQWRTLMSNNPSATEAPNTPVNRVSWFDALAWCNARSRADGLEVCYDLGACSGTPGVDFNCPDNIDFDLDCEGWRLPTEAEWEFAYRAGTTTSLYVGNLAQLDCAASDAFIDRIAWCGVNAQGVLHPVAGKEPNALGLFDMSGNVLEWTWDRFSRDFYAMSPEEDPVGPPVGPERVVRGGTAFGCPDGCRAASRFPRRMPNGDLGFRPVRSLTGTR